MKLREKTMLPSHTVGLELQLRFLLQGKRRVVIIPHCGLGTGLNLRKYWTLCLSHHPTQWAWNGERYFILAVRERWKSPSHAVGLEHL